MICVQLSVCADCGGFIKSFNLKHTTLTFQTTIRVRLVMWINAPYHSTTIQLINTQLTERTFFFFFAQVLIQDREDEFSYEG